MADLGLASSGKDWDWAVILDPNPIPRQLVGSGLLGVVPLKSVAQLQVNPLDLLIWGNGKVSHCPTVT